MTGPAGPAAYFQEVHETFHRAGGPPAPVSWTWTTTLPARWFAFASRTR
jgi:hypothetical protein